MPIVIDQPHLIDTLRYRVAARRTLAQDDVRVSVQVNALLRTNDRDRVAIEGRIREALDALITAEWVFSRIEREADATGFERVRLIASTRTSSAENYNLAERARIASRDGLTLTDARVDYAFSNEKIDTVFDELRHEILRRVTEQAQSISAATGRAWRIGDIAFGTVDPEAGGRMTGKGVYRDEEVTWLGVADGDDRGIAGAERISLLASVTLKAPV